MMRLASAMLCSSAVVGIAESLGLGDVQGTFVDGPAGDGADDARRLGVEQGLDVAQVVDATRGDHRNARGRSQGRGEGHIAALHHAV
nr:hypothetical protein [Tanacetum cinerariifolium]